MGFIGDDGLYNWQKSEILLNLDGETGSPS